MIRTEALDANSTKSLIVVAVLAGAVLCSAGLVLSPLAAAIPIGIFLVWCWFHFPAAGIIAAVLTFPLQRSLLGMPAYSISAGLTLLACVEFLRVRHFKGAFPSVRRNAPHYLALALVAYIVISLYVRASLEQYDRAIPDLMATEGATFFKYIFHAFLLFLLISLFGNSLKLIRTLLKSHLVLVAVLGAIGLQQAIVGHNELLVQYWRGKTSVSPLGLELNRVTSLFLDSNHFGNFLVSSVFICLPLLFLARESGLRRFVTASILAAAFVCIFLTYSVGNWLSLLVGALVWLVLTGRIRLLLAAFITILAFTAVTGNTGIPFQEHLPPLVVEKINAVLRLDFIGESPVHIRSDLIRAGMEMFRSNPLFGAGYGTFQPWVGKSAYYMRLTKNIVYSHNSYVLILAELGLAGLCLLGLFVGSCLRRGFRCLTATRNGDVRIILCGLISSIAANLVFLATYGSILHSLPFWIPLALILAVSAAARREVPSPISPGRVSGGGRPMEEEGGWESCTGTV